MSLVNALGFSSADTRLSASKRRTGCLVPSDCVQRMVSKCHYFRAIVKGSHTGTGAATTAETKRVTRAVEIFILMLLSCRFGRATRIEW